MNLLVTGAAGFIGPTHVRVPLAADGPGAPRIAVLGRLTRREPLERRTGQVA
ncbi:hypothetical protein [Streptomyces sp. YIM S03343]